MRKCSNLKKKFFNWCWHSSSTLLNSKNILVYINNGSVRITRASVTRTFSWEYLQHYQNGTSFDTCQSHVIILLRFFFILFAIVQHGITVIFIWDISYLECELEFKGTIVYKASVISSMIFHYNFAWKIPPVSMSWFTVQLNNVT